MLIVRGNFLFQDPSISVIILAVCGSTATDKIKDIRRELLVMGLIKAALDAAGSTLGDQWLEYFYCDSIDKDVLVVKGQKQTKGSNKGSDNIISNGSGIAVADGQCMIIVDDGKVVEICAEPGKFTYDASSEPSIFSGSLGSSIIESFKTFGKRFAMGGNTGHDQRVYYFNTKEITENKFGTPNPIPFRVVDSKIMLDIDVSLRCSGLYSYKIVDPILFYTNVCGNVASQYNRSEIDQQLKTEFISALTPSIGKLSDLEIRPNQIVSHSTDLENNLNEALSMKWEKLRGIRVVSVAMNPPTLPPEDQEMIKEAQRSAQQSFFNSDPTRAAGTLVGAQAEAMKTAAGNSAGAMTGFLGMGMAGNAGGMNAQNLFAMGAQQQAAQAVAPSQAAGWTCECGTTNTGKFCSNCGKPQPAPAAGWTCECGTANTGKFCSNCGKPQPASNEWTCSCGTVNTGKFCSNCGSQRP